MQGHNDTHAAAARRLVEAAAWHSHLNETGASTSDAFTAWLAADPANAAAWRRVQVPWDLLGEHATTPLMMQARQAALGDARRATRRRWMRSLAGTGMGAGRTLAAALAFTSLGGLMLWLALKPEIYRTDIGERRVVELRDGSQLSLDAQTEVRVAYSKRARELKLLRGQARFDVARDVERPFSVQAGEQKVVATGTAFNIDLMESDLRVTLIEGSIVVLGIATSVPADMQPKPADRPHASSEAPSHRPPTESGTALASGQRSIELKAGEQLSISSRSRADIAPASIESATAWQEGRLVFEHEPLSFVARRMNRYSRRPLRIADERTGQLRISGVFKTHDLDGFVATLTQYFPLQAMERSDGTIELRHD